MSTRLGRISGLALAGGLLLAQAARAQDYVVDPAVSDVGFDVRFMFGAVHGRFEAFEGRATLSGGQLASVQAQVQTASINTNNGRRDRHLRSDHFLDVEKFPTIAFRSTVVEKVAATGLRVKGLLTIRGVTREVVLEGELRPKGDGARYVFRAEAKVNRQDWGVSWNQHVDGMDLLIRDEVQLVLRGELLPPLLSQRPLIGAALGRPSTLQCARCQQENPPPRKLASSVSQVLS